jgi:hypothetical protein
MRENSTSEALLENLPASTAGVSSAAISSLFRLSSSASRAKSAAVFFGFESGFPRPIPLFRLSLHFLELRPSDVPSEFLFTGRKKMIISKELLLTRTRFFEKYFRDYNAKKFSFAILTSKKIEVLISLENP